MNDANVIIFITDILHKFKKMDRRAFLKISASAAGGLLITWAVPGCNDETKPIKLNPYLLIGEDNSIKILLSKVEMGQGIWTTLTMLIAEELDCDWKKITVEHGPPGNEADFLPPVAWRSTGGSESTKSEFDNYRKAGATARTMLVQAAAKKWGLSPEECRTENGYVIARDQKISYGQVAGDAATLPVPDVTLREPKEWKLIGKSQKRLDAAAKINGTAKYGIDVQFPGLLVAVVAHPPVFGGKVRSFDDSAAKAIQGVKQVISVPTGVAVLADNFWAAKTGRDALTIEWENGANETINSKMQLEEYSRLSKTKGLTVKQKGDVEMAFKKCAGSIEAEYSFPYLAHAPMEPLNCTVKISNEKCEVWAGTQSPLPRQAEVAAFLGLKPEQVAFYTPFLGGSFGRRGSFSKDWIIEAVQIAKQSGYPVKLIWTREDDIKGGYYRPVYVHRVRIGIDQKGLPAAWQHCIVGQSLFKDTPLQDLIVANGIDYSCITTGEPYTDNIPAFSFELVTVDLGVPVLPWRSVGNTHTAFVMETLIDELAARAQTDPVEYRRGLLKDHPRHLAALELAAEKAGWHNPPAAGVFRGIAVHEAMYSFVSQVVEISIEEESIKVHRVVCAIDCGLAVNPDGVIAQMEGGIIYGLTAALYGEITLEQGRVMQSNFHDYRMLRLHESPAIEVYIVPGDNKMGGAGEPGVPPTAPALANAIFAATGKRLRNLPLRLK
jgi:isoquinoline 1-oxidoreductase beta subunit